jgi:hypothetical protein
MKSSLLQSTEYHGRKFRKSENRPIPHKWYKVLSMHMAGKTAKDIAEELNYSLSSIYRILDHEDVLIVRQQMLKYYDQEFEALFPEVIRAIREGLLSQDKYLEAASLWGRMAGKGAVKSQQQGPMISAENVALVILQKAQQKQEEEPIKVDYKVYEKDPEG